MIQQLQVNKGKKIVLELTNGRIISGTILDVSEQFVHLGTDDGVGTIPVNFVQIIWETTKSSLTEENMDQIAGMLRESIKEQIACTGAQFTCSLQYICRPPDICTGAFACPGTYVPFQGGSQCPIAFACAGTQFFGIVGPPEGGASPFAPQPTQAGCNMQYSNEPGAYAGQTGQGGAKAQINCTAFPGFTCSLQYICRPPDNCAFSFACPGSYAPGFPSGGGGCPVFACGPFQFGQPCGPFQFGQPCGPFQFGQPCRPFQFGQPCRPFQFGQPCGFQFGCGSFAFACGNFQFGGSTCGTIGGFTCPGQQFFGVVGPPGGSQCGTPGGFICPGFQFTGAPVKPPGMTTQASQEPY
ncbi:MAG: hypothetical protein ACYC38_13590, partial [Eubacteriales bacterium]